MKAKWLKIFFLTAVLGIFLSAFSVIRAQSCESSCPSGDSKCLSERISDCQSKVSSLHGQANTLSNQIAQFNAQIQLTTLKITQTQEQIKLLGGRIDQLETSLGSLSNAFSERAIETYKIYRSGEPIFLLFDVSNISDLVSSYHYLGKIQEADRNLLIRLQKAQNLYVDQKVEQETLAKQLDDQQKQLNTQKSAKAKLLADTRNSEARYQSLLSEARAELEAIQAIIAGKGKETNAGHVGQNQRIASIIQGASCNSGGTHTHFIVSQNGVAQNPFGYLKGGVDYDNCSGSSCGNSDGDPFNPSGSWDWPISPKIIFNQGYGSTWAVRNTYVGSIYSVHNGIDINSASSSEIRSVKSGELYQGSYVGQNGCSLRYVRVHHDEGGLDTFYLHINY